MRKGRDIMRGKGVSGECRMFNNMWGNKYEFIAMSQKSRPSNEHRM